MSVDYRYRGDLNCLFLRYKGEVTRSQFSAVIHRVLADAEVPPGHLRISDLRFATRSPATEILRGMATEADSGEKHKPAIRAAILVCQDVQFGLARLVRGHREEGQEAINVFRDYGDALEWLGLPGDMPDIFLLGRLEVGGRTPFALSRHSVVPDPAFHRT